MGIHWRSLGIVSSMVLFASGASAREGVQDNEPAARDAAVEPAVFSSSGVTTMIGGWI